MQRVRNAAMASAQLCVQPGGTVVPTFTHPTPNFDLCPRLLFLLVYEIQSDKVHSRAT